MFRLQKAIVLAMVVGLGLVLAGGTFDSVAYAGGDCGCSAPELKACCGQPCITYRHHCRARRVCCDCQCDAPVQVILKVTDPNCCCTIEVPVCVPACCDDVPKGCAGVGLLGRGITTFTWCCGFKARVVVKRTGDVVVHTYGS